MSGNDDSYERALLERLNQELSNSIQRCRNLLRGYGSRIGANVDRLGTLHVVDGEGLYYAVREQSERAMSRSATDSRAIAAHAEMADRYEALAVVFGAKRTREFPADYL